MLPFDITNETLTNDNFWTMSAAEKHRNIGKPANPQQRSSESKVRIPWRLTILTLCSRLLFPGAGQFCQNRIAAGFLYAVPAATIIFGIIAQPVELVELGFEQRLKITTVALFIWIVSQVEIYTHRQHLFGDN